MSRFDLFFVLVDECNEVTDYAIARTIVDLHCHKQEAVERTYSEVRAPHSSTSHVTPPPYPTPQEDVQRYVTFAKHFKPKVERLSLCEATSVCKLCFHL